MDTHSKKFTYGELNDSQTLPNGGMKHGPSVDNPAFPDLYTISSSSLPDSYSANHLIYRRNNEDNNADGNRNYYGTSGKSSIYLQQFSSLSNSLDLRSSLPHTVGPGFRRGNNIPNGNLGYSQTTGRQTGANLFPKKTHFDTTSRLPYKRFGKNSKFRFTAVKHNCISYFDIETDQGSNYYYHPGENITGTININVLKSLEIRFVELIVVGQGQFTKRKSSSGFPQTLRETYLYKEKCVIGTRDPHYGSVLPPGQYNSKFRVRLPRDLPSTIHHEDNANELKFHIWYGLKVRLCDDAGPTWSQNASVHYRRTRVFLEKQINFNVQRNFDLTTIPDANFPIVHTEQVFLSCARQEAAVVTLSIDRSVFLAGDDIRLHLQVALPSSQKVKDITCSLQEHITTNPKLEPMIFTLSKTHLKDLAAGERTQTNPSPEQKFVVIIATHTRMLSPYSLGSSQVKLEYFLAVELRFTPAGGKLSFKVPVGIGPCADPINAEKITSRKAIPLFNRATRFPCFSTRSLPDSSSSDPSNSRSTASVVVRTKYSNGLFARCFLCCLGGID